MHLFLFVFFICEVIDASFQGLQKNMRPLKILKSDTPAAACEQQPQSSLTKSAGFCQNVANVAKRVGKLCRLLED